MRSDCASATWLRFLPRGRGRGPPQKTLLALGEITGAPGKTFIKKILEPHEQCECELSCVINLVSYPART